MNQDKVEYWSPGGAKLLGPRAPHELRDVYRTLHGPAPSRMPVSHEQRGAFRRYDHVLASPQFTVAAVDYRFDNRMRALIHHALVSVTLEL